MKAINLKGMGVALITPFDKQGRVDYATLSQLIEFQLQSATDYLVALGTTAETPTLTPEEQKEIVKTIVSKTGRRVPVVMGVGGNNTAALVHKLQHDDYTGIDVILSVVPYYNRPSQEGLYQHFKHIAQATSLPVLLYNVPARTGTNMAVETTLRLANDFDNIIGIKEASGNIAQIDEIIRNKPDGFQVVSGDDGITLPLIAKGATGVISVIGNAFPKEFGCMVRLALAGEYDKAQFIHDSFKDLFELLTTDGNPAGVKCVLSALNRIENTLRLPLVPARPSTFERVQKALQELNVDC